VRLAGASRDRPKAALSKAFYAALRCLCRSSRRPQRGLSAGLQVRIQPGQGQGGAGEIRLQHREAREDQVSATNGHFPSDYDIARAIVQMWQRVGIEAELETIEYAKYFELNRGAKLPEATLYSWDNATGDPEIYAGYLLNPKMPFSAWKGMDSVRRSSNCSTSPTTTSASRVTARSTKLRSKPAPRSAAASVVTVVRSKNLNYAKYQNGWILAIRWTVVI